ncbi:MAG: hypothetical protein UY96_C0017G0045 [Parcubacteria group bacterium GW2011_GWB1_56_8]|nr:MAG: hypothetical protein UY96_C0017G0045 [Parcubacteria group bacterium GW2011_GWB1_56_8]
MSAIPVGGQKADGRVQPLRSEADGTIHVTGAVVVAGAVDQGLPNAGGALAWPVTDAAVLARLNVALSTRASEATLATRASEATVASILAQLDVALSTRASEATAVATQALLGAGLPAALGQGTKATSLAVVLPSDADGFLGADRATLGSGVVEGRHTQVSANFTQVVANNNVSTTTAGGGSVTQGSGLATFATGVAATASATGRTIGTVRYASGREIYALITAIFTTPTDAASTQRIGLYDANNGFYIGYNGTGFGVAVRKTAVDTFTARASWNGDLLTGAAGSKFTRGGVPEAVDLTKENLYRIRFAWLGAAPIRFEIMSPDGEWVTFHMIRQPNVAAIPSVDTPDLPVAVEVTKTVSDATDLVLKTSCWEGGIVGSLTPLQNPNIDAGNSSTTTLGIAGVFTGIGFDVSAYSAISVTAFANVAGTLNLEFSTDNVTFEAPVVYVVAAGANVTVNTGPQARYFRVRYVNGAVVQTTFRLQTIERPAAIQPSTVPVATAISPSGDALLTKGVITGVTTAGGGAFVDVKVAPSGAVQVGGSIDQGTGGASAWLAKEQRAATSSVARVASSAVNVTLLASNANRLGVRLHNDSTKICYVKFGITATSIDFTVRMNPQDFYADDLYTGRIDGIWSAANGGMQVTELTA